MAKGRGNSYSITTKEALRIEMNLLIKSKQIVNGCEIHFSLNWTNGSSISAISVINEAEKYLRINYQQTDKSTGVKTDYDYKIQIDSIPSNLGKGLNHYFICPVSYRRCKILYLCYGANVFKCREAYNNRIYYTSQNESKVNGLHSKFNNVESKLNVLFEKMNKQHYKGKPTKRNLRIEKLEQLKMNIDEVRFANIGRLLSKYSFF